MPFGRMLNIAFSDKRLLPLVLSDMEFAQHGYRWGYDGEVWYCFLNPNKVRFEIFKKDFYWRFLLVALVPIIQFVSLFLILIAPKHFTRTAKAQPAAVVSDGPQMMLPFNMGQTAVGILLVVALFLPVFVGLVVGLKFAGVGAIPGTLLGAIAGVNLFALTLWLLGVLSVPYGPVVAPSFSEAAPAVPGSYFFGRGSSTAFSSYQIGPLQPASALAWSCGGLAPIVVGGKPAGTLPGLQGTNYSALMNRNTTLVVWGLVTWDLAKDPIIGEAIDSQRLNYGSNPPVGLILVAGCESWSFAQTTCMLVQHTVDAVAVDGSTSALLGSSGQLVLETELLKDVIQRYGFMCVPE